MYLNQITLFNFRSHKSLNLTFNKGISCLLGNNGQGKTNIVEALYFLANQHSHRVANNQPLIHKNADKAKISGNFSNNQLQTQIEIELSKTNGLTIWHNKNTVRSKEVLGLVQVVIFAPEDLEILKGDPGERRYFIDQTATNLSPRVAGLRSDYERVLKQRNSLLKSASMLTGKAQQNALSTLDVWNERLVSLAAEIILLRLQTLKQLIPVTNELYQQIAPENQITFKYVSGWSDEEIKLDISWITNQLLKALTDCSQEELKRGVTLAGPHRDDVLFELNNLPVKGYASHGETWSLALSLKLAVLKLIESDINTTSSPILILDDVFAELDELRRKQLMDIALGVEQTIITAAAEVDLPENLSAKIYRFSNGEVINE